jgi:BirA family biotin operon repressor/biotin-[acetyl-CoA-carboxylase] ligase
LRRHCGVAALLKWPNDVVATDRKLAGVLCELCTPPAGRPVLVSGFGIDVNQDRFPPELDQVATSVYLQTGHRTNRNLLLKDILEEAERAYLCAAGGGEDLILRQARTLCSTLGQQVRVDLGTGEARGWARDLAPDGSLVLEGEDGRRQALRTGDVHHLRPGQPA